MKTPKGMVPDHWTWRDRKAVETGWHCPKKRGKAEPEDAQPTGRGIIATSMKRKPKREQGTLL